MKTPKKLPNPQRHATVIQKKAFGMSNQAPPVSRFFGLLVLVIILVTNDNSLFAQTFNNAGITVTGSNTNSQAECSSRPEFQTSIGHYISGVPDDGEEAFSVKPANDCGYIAVGQTSLPPTTYGNMMAVKTDKDGNAEWVKTYSFGFGTSIDKGVLTNIEALGDGYIATGWTRFDVRSLIILRLENDGSVRWSRVQAGSHWWEDGYDIEPTPDGGFVVAGHTQDRVFMIHLDANGTQNWSKSYGNEGQVWRGYSVEPTDDDGDGLQDDGFIICGSMANGGLKPDWMVLKTNHLGVLQNAATLGTTHADELFSIKQIGVNQFIIGGYTADVTGLDPNRKLATFAHYQPALYTTSHGAAIFDDGVNHSVINALEWSHDGNVILSGSIDESPSSSLRDAFLIKSPLTGGSILWNKIYGATGEDDWSNSVEGLNGSGYVLAGGSDDPSSGDGDFFIVKTDENGNSDCSSDGPFTPDPSAIMYSYIEYPTTTPYGDLSYRFVLPQSETPDEEPCQGSMKKDANATSISKIEIGQYSIYPNPVSNGSSLQIVLDESITNHVEVTLTDITGKVHFSKEFSLAKGTSELSIPIKNLSPGIYHLSVQSELGTSVQKVLVE